MSLALAVGLAVFPVPEVLDYIVLFSGLIDQFPLALEDSRLEIALVARPVCEGVNPMAVLFIILPVSRVGVAVDVAIHAIAVLLLASNAALIAVAVAQVLDGYHLGLHLICECLYIQYQRRKTVRGTQISGLEITDASDT